MKIEATMQPTPDRIRAIRTSRGLTQSQLAEMLNVSFVTISRWETGYSKPSDLAWQQILKIEESRIGSEAGLKSSRSPAAQITDFLADPERVQVFVEGERLEFGHLYNPAFATEISLIDPLPHQRIAVYERMLPQSRLRFLLADDAGAGKTIMTGMYIREMLSRRLIRRVLIVPPAGLVGNWYREMRMLFSLPFEIASGASIRSGNPFMGEGSDLRIMSVDTLAGERMFSNLQSSTVEPYDLVIFDEAHKLSANLEPDFYVRKTDRYRLAEAIAGIPMGDERWDLSWSPAHLLLLTATPHMGKDYPYFAIWRLLEPETLTTQDAFASYPEDARQRHFIRRVKEEMADMQGRPIYPTRESSTHSFELTTGDISEQKLYDDMTAYLRYYYNMAPFLNRSAVRLAMSVFQRRLASSTWALLRSLERRLERVEELITDIREGKLEESRLRDLTKDRARDVFFDQTADEEHAEDGEEENEIEDSKAVAHIIATSLTGLQTERDQVRRLVRLAQQVYDEGQESKFETLRELLQEPRFKNEKVLIFTEHRDTLAFLVRRLEGMGYTGQVAQIHGGMPYTEREEQVESFRKPKDERSECKPERAQPSRNDGGATYMVATDAAGEGINLQFCWLMVNYDIPWNPARLEQRMGRIHRYKQQHDPVIILNLIAGSTREGRVLKTLLDKLERIRKELRSDKVFDVVGRLFEGLSLRDYMESAITDEGATAVQLKIEGALTKEQVLANEARQKSLYGEGGDIRREIPRLREEANHEVYRRLLPGYVRQYIERAAPMAGIGIDGDMNPYFSFRLMEAGSLDTLWPVLEGHPPAARRRLTVYRPAESGAIWIHPGEALFERFRAIVASRLAPNARQGAIFADAAAEQPYFFHVAQVSIVRSADTEFRAFTKEETVEVRLVAIKQFLNGHIEECPVEHLLLLKGNRQAAAAFAGIAARSSENIEAARAWVQGHIGQALARDRQQNLTRTLASRLDFLKRGYQFQEAELAAMRVRYTDKARTGDGRAQAELSRIRDRQRLLTQRRDLAMRERQREPELIVTGPIELLAHALVVPSADPEDRKKQDAAVEQIAMQVAQAHEESQGARVWYVHTPELARRAGLPDYPGFDLLSERPNGEKRSIEVKGRARVGEIEVSGNEWAKACNLRDRYWLYVVFECASATPRLLKVPDPFGRLLAKNRGGVTIESTAVFNAAE